MHSANDVIIFSIDLRVCRYFGSLIAHWLWGYLVNNPTTSQIISNHQKCIKKEAVAVIRFCVVLESCSDFRSLYLRYLTFSNIWEMLHLTFLFPACEHVLISFLRWERVGKVVVYRIKQKICNQFLIITSKHQSRERVCYLKHSAFFGVSLLAGSNFHYMILNKLICKVKCSLYSYRICGGLFKTVAINPIISSLTF